MELSKDTIETIKETLSSKLYELEIKKSRKEIVYEDYETRKKYLEKALEEFNIAY